LTAHTFKRPEPISTTSDILVLHHFEFATKYLYITQIRVFRYFCNWILESYSFQTNPIPDHSRVSTSKLWVLSCRSWLVYATMLSLPCWWTAVIQYECHSVAPRVFTYSV